MTNYGSMASRIGGPALLALALSGCGATPNAIAPPEIGPALAGPAAADKPPAKIVVRKKEFHGVASWYGAWHQGKRTASGARFNRNALTAAHKSLPLGTRVEVTNLDNQRRVVLTINDRGPYIRGREIDVTERAAKTLGFHEEGLARVRIRILPG